MEKNDRQRILAAMASNRELKRLYERHLLLDAKVAEFSKRRVLTASEESEYRESKLEKLRDMERMMQMIASSPEAVAAPP